MNRSLDIRDHERPIQRTQNTSPKPVYTPTQKDCQTETLLEIPQIIAYQPESPFQRSVPASQRDVQSQQTSNRTERQRHEESGPQDVSDNSSMLLSLQQSGSCVPSANVVERGSAPPVHLTNSASVVDPPAKPSSSGDAVLSYTYFGSHSTTEPTSACPGNQGSSPSPCHRAQQREGHCPIDSILANKLRDKESAKSFSGEGSSQSPSKRDPRFITTGTASQPFLKKSSRSSRADTKSKTSIKIRSGYIVNQGSRPESTFKEESASSIAHESTDFDGESPDISARKSTELYFQTQSDYSSTKGPDSCLGEISESSETHYSANSKGSGSRFTPPVGCLKRFKEGTNPQIYSSFTTPNQTTGRESNSVSSSSSSPRTREYSKSAYNCPSTKSRGKRGDENTVSRIPNVTVSPDATEREARFALLQTRSTTSGTPEERKKTSKHSVTTQNRLQQRRAVASENNTEVNISIYHKNPGSTQCVESDSDSSAVSSSAFFSTSTTPACTSGLTGCESSPSSGRTRATKNRERGERRKRKLNGGKKLDRGNAGGNKKVSRSLTILSTVSPSVSSMITLSTTSPSVSSMTTLSTTSPSVSSMTTLSTMSPLLPSMTTSGSRGDTSHQASIQSESANFPNNMDEPRHHIDEVQIKKEIVDEEYPHFRNSVPPSAVDDDAIRSTLHGDQRTETERVDSQDIHTHNALQRPETCDQWTILFETPLPDTSCCDTPDLNWDEDIKEDIDTKEDVNEDRKENVSEYISKVIKRDVDKDSKEHIDTDLMGDGEKDEKVRMDQDVARHCSKRLTEELGSSEIAKTFKKECDEDKPPKEADSNELTSRCSAEYVPKDHTIQTPQSTCFPGDCKTSTGQHSRGRRKQKSPRQYQKRCVLQPKRASKHQCSQTINSGNQVLEELCIRATSRHLSPSALTHHTQCLTRENLCLPQFRLQVPAAAAKSIPTLKDSRRRHIRCGTQAVTLPRKISSLLCSNLESEPNIQSSQTSRNTTCKLDTVKSSYSALGMAKISPADTKLSTGNPVLATFTMDTKPLVSRSPPDTENQPNPSEEETEVKGKLKASEQVQHNQAQSLITSNPSPSFPTVPLSLLRIPYLPVSLHSPPFSGLIPALSKHHTQPSTSVPLMTTAGSINVQKMAHSPYIPIVPKMPNMKSAVQTTLLALGPSQVTGNSAVETQLPAEYQIRHKLCNTTPDVLSGLTVQQHQMAKGNGIVMQGGIPHLGIIPNQVFSSGSGGIPIFFFPNVSQLLSPDQLQTQATPVNGLITSSLSSATKTAAAVTAPPATQPISHSSRRAKVTYDQVPISVNNSTHPDTRCSENENCEVHSHDTSKPAEANSSQKENNFKNSEDVDCPAESVKTRTEVNVPSMLVSSSKPLSENRADSSVTSNLEKKECSGIKDSQLSTATESVFQDDDSKKDEDTLSFTTASDVRCQRVVCKKTRHVTSTHTSTVAVSKSGRKRKASTRYDFHTDIELSDSSNFEDITPITSDDEWTPEKDNDGESTHSSEDEDSKRKSGRRGYVQDLFPPARKNKIRKIKQTGQYPVCEGKRNGIQTCFTRSFYSFSMKQPQAKPQTITAKPAKPQQDNVDQNLEAVNDKFERETTQEQNDRKEKSKPWQIPNPSSVTPCVYQAQAPRKRRRTPYTKEELTCRICSKSFINIYRLRRHEFSHGDERPYVCDECGKAFKQSGHRNEHRLTHSANKRSFLCNVCGVVITSRSSFRYHLLSHNELLPGSLDAASCEIVIPAASDAPPFSHGSGHGTQNGAHHSDISSDVGTNYHVTDILERMMTRTTVTAAYDCPHCMKRFATAQSLNCHLETHQEVELRCHVQPFTCWECGRSFTYRHNLEKHRECHVKPEKRADSYKRKVQAAIADGKPHFVCDTCGKVYLRKETLTKHIKTHLGLKPYQCKECLKSFTQKIHLTVHSRLHTGSRPFQCRTCHSCFLDSTALARHVMRDVCKAEGFAFNVGKRGRKPFHTVVDESVKAIVKRNRERRQKKGPDALRCGLCPWTGKYQGFLRRHIQRCHPTQVQKALKKDSSEAVPTSSRL